MTRRIRVLVADDSAATRGALAATLEQDPNIQVVGEAKDGQEARDLALSLRPDVITMDVLMPGLGGLEAISLIMTELAAHIVVVSSAVHDQALALTFRAMSAGALEVLAKPVGLTGAAFEAWGERLRESIRLMADVPVVRRFRAVDGRRPNAAKTRSVALPGRGLALIAIGASTGGPVALAHILSALPRALPAPILVAQHLTRGFVRGLVRWLDEEAELDVMLAKAGEVARPGCVYLAPDGQDLGVDDEGCLSLEPSQREPCPSVDHLFEAVAKSFGSRGAAVLLTGMGQDGARGLLALRRAGGSTVAQDQASALVFGMPAAAIELGAAELVLPLEGIAPSLLRLSEHTPN